DQGIYRPSPNSKMRSLGQPFDAVAREQIILDIYSHVKPLDAYLSNTTTVTSFTKPWVTVVDPNVISVQWLLDGNSLTTSGGQIPQLGNYRLLAGTHTLSARAYDPTD